MTLAELVLAGLLSLPQFHEDRGPEVAELKQAQSFALADGIATAAAEQKVATPRDWAALVIAIGFHESGFSLRIHRGECIWEKRECDAALIKGERVFRARSPWQMHAYGVAAGAWDQLIGLEHTETQARVASRRLQTGYYTCRGAADWLIATVNGFAGRRCGHIWPGLEQRVATWRAVRRAMDRAAARKAGT